MISSSDSPSLSPPALSVPTALTCFRAEVDNIEAAAVRIPQRLRHILFVLLAASARACSIGGLAGVRRPSHQLGDGCRFAKQISGPWQLLKMLQFGRSLQESRCGEWIARGNALSPATLSKVLGIVSRHQYASFANDAGDGGNSTSRIAERPRELHWPSSNCGVG